MLASGRTAWRTASAAAGLDWSHLRHPHRGGHENPHYRAISGSAFFCWSSSCPRGSQLILFARRLSAARQQETPAGGVNRVVRSVPQRQFHHCCHRTGGRQRHSLRRARLPNCLNSHIESLPNPRTDPVVVQYGFQRFPLRLDALENR